MKFLINRKFPSIVSTLFIFLSFISFSFSNEEIHNSQTSSAESIESAHNEIHQNRAPKKKLTILFYISAANDLEFFSRANIAQIAAIGSNDHLNLIIHLDTKTPNGQKITKLYYVEQNKLIVLYSGPGMDSGDPETLINFVKTATQQFPAQDVALVLWNHGTGIIDVGRPRNINPSTLFIFNPLNNILELNRSIPFLEFVEQEGIDPRGICFDDTTGNYLTNQKLEYALQIICQHLGKKLTFLAFDACLMAMIEVANIAKDYAEFMIGSEEVELGAGWNYNLALMPLATQPIPPLQLVCHIVNAYEKAYARITNDYTQSAINLQEIRNLEENINYLAQLLITCLIKQRGTSVHDTIKACRHRLLCTHFDEPSYIDLRHFYQNILYNLPKFQCISASEEKQLKQELTQTLKRGIELIKKAVLCNVTGKNLSKAGGLSIYFPEHTMHTSYPKTKFAATNAWYFFLNTYLQAP